MPKEAVVEIENLTLRLGAFSMRQLNLQVFEGEYLVILGPTGAGKTVLLDCILGIHRPAGGFIRLRGVDVTNWLPEERNVGYVPQDYALFPTMTVEENVGFGPSVRKWSREKKRERVKELLQLLGIEHLRHRLPTALSGGEKQRVAVGRALAVDPAILLLDEPLSALDESRRSELAREFRSIQEKVGATFLHICHNLDEATEVADRVAIVDDGHVIQLGSVEEILRRPVSPFVANFTGCSNVFSVEPHEEGCQLEDGNVLAIEQKLTEAAIVAIRPELLLLEPTDKQKKECVLTLSGRIIHRIDRVSSHFFDVKMKDSNLSWRISIARRVEEAPPSVGDQITIGIPQKAVHLMV